MAKIAIAAAVIGLAVVGGGATLGLDWWKAREMKRAVAEHLRDPESARFREIYRVGSAICGEVNAKNAMGGYVGFRRFALAESGQLYTEPDGDTKGGSLSSRIEDLEELKSFLQVYEAQCEGAAPRS